MRSYEMIGACSMDGGNVHTEFRFGNPMARSNLGGQGVDARILLKFITEK
jgi:hypothetical protein